jgi:hypothetical protein
MQHMCNSQQFTPFHDMEMIVSTFGMVIDEQLSQVHAHI